MANDEALKASVAKNGEVMIRLDTGEKIGLHIHNVKFDDTTKEVIVDAARDIFHWCRQSIILLDTQRGL
jgi:hypothetical protein